MPRRYVQRVESRAAAAGVSFSEALRQLIDAGEAGDLRAVGQIREQLRAIGLAAERLAHTTTALPEAQGQLRVIRGAVLEVARLVGKEGRAKAEG